MKFLLLTNAGFIFRKYLKTPAMSFFKRMHFLLYALAAFVLCTSFKTDDPCDSESSQVLEIAPIAQQQWEWCWITCGEMIFRYYGVQANNPISYQCGIIGTLYPNCSNNCLNCSMVSASSMQNIQWMLNTYPEYQFWPAPPDFTSHVYSTANYFALSPESVSREIDAGRPILAGITPEGAYPGATPQHAVLVVGYDDTDDGFYVIVNDPWPYRDFVNQHPYENNGGCMLQPGQYRIRYSAFKTNMSWTQSLSGIQ